MSNEEEIRTLFERMSDAARRKDLDAVMSCYSDDVVAFDLMAPLQHKNAKSFRGAWKIGLEMAETFELEFRELDVTADNILGFAHAIMHCKVLDKNGKTGDMWLRHSAGLRKLGGQWKIVHEQTSVPLDMKSMKPLMDLRP